MASEFSQYLANELLDHVLRNSSYTPPTTVYMSLHTTTCSKTAAGTELSGDGYARQAVEWDAAATSATANTNDEEFTATGNWGTVVSIAFWDALTNGNMLMFDNDITDKAIDSDVYRFAAGNLAVTL